MTNSFTPPERAADNRAWCRWAWLAGRQVVADHETRASLHQMALDATAADDVRRTALSAYWMVADLPEALRLEEELMAQNDLNLALLGLWHPRWHGDAAWLDACGTWLGRDARIDETIARLWSWANRSTKWVRVPLEVRERAGLSEEIPINWAETMLLGVERERQAPGSPFEGFWRRHMQEWADRWMRWEASVWLYRWRLEEEGLLTAWTESPPYPASWPAVPEVNRMHVVEPRPAGELLYLTVLGLGYLMKKDRLCAI